VNVPFGVVNCRSRKSLHEPMSVGAGVVSSFVPEATMLPPASSIWNVASYLTSGPVAKLSAGSGSPGIWGTGNGSSGVNGGNGVGAPVSGPTVMSADSVNVPLTGPNAKPVTSTCQVNVPSPLSVHCWASVGGACELSAT
jgi:hypothetical protein